MTLIKITFRPIVDDLAYPESTIFLGNDMRIIFMKDIILFSGSDIRLTYDRDRVKTFEATYYEKTLTPAS